MGLFGKSKEDKIEELVENGYALLENGDYKKCIEYFDKAIEIDPVFGLIKKGELLLNLDKLEESIECCDKVISIEDSLNHMPFSLKGLALTKLGRYEEANECYDKALEINPLDSDSLRNKGITVFQLGRLRESKECLGRASEIDPDNYVSWKYRGIILRLLGEFEESIQCLDNAIKTTSSNSMEQAYSKNEELKGIRAIAIELKKLDDECTALDASELEYADESKIIRYDKALEIDPNNIWALECKGVALKLLGRNEEARECFDRVSNLYTDNNVEYF